MANEYLKEFTQQKYEAGFVTDVETEIIEAGLNEDIIRQISAKKEEPEWLLEFRLTAFRYWQPSKLQSGRTSIFLRLTTKPSPTTLTPLRRKMVRRKLTQS